MEMPLRTAGITALQQPTGCALACHETDFKDGESNPLPGWGTIDSYTYAENIGITLRIDNVRASGSKPGYDRCKAWVQ